MQTGCAHLSASHKHGSEERSAPAPARGCLPWSEPARWRPWWGPGPSVRTGSPGARGPSCSLGNGAAARAALGDRGQGAGTVTPECTPPSSRSLSHCCPPGKAFSPSDTAGAQTLPACGTGHGLTPRCLEQHASFSNSSLTRDILPLEYFCAKPPSLNLQGNIHIGWKRHPRRYRQRCTPSPRGLTWTEPCPALLLPPGGKHIPRAARHPTETSLGISYTRCASKCSFLTRTEM